MKMKKIINYGDEQRELIKRYGKWSVTKSINNQGYYPNQLMIDDGYNSYYMNSDKRFDNFYPIPSGLISWLENTGYKYIV